MDKIFTTRDNKRENGLGSIDAIWKVLTEIFWAKKGGRDYSVTAICRDNHIRRMKTDLVEGLYDWETAPTREQAEKMHQIICHHEAENWAKPQKNEEQPAEQTLIGFDFGEGNDSSSIIELWGHRYKITRLD